MVRKNIPVNKIQRNLLTSGGRLAAERERLGRTVQDFALHCGVTKQTQIKYEGNQNSPDIRYLDKCFDIGVDVMYVLTGDRSPEAPMTPELQNLLDAYQAAPEVIRRAVFSVLLSPYKNEWDSARVTPGYFNHHILGEDDLRYERHMAPGKWGGKGREGSGAIEQGDSDVEGQAGNPDAS